MLRTTLKDLRARKLRLLATGFAVLLGVAFMTGSLVLTDTIGRTFDQLLVDAYDGADAVVRGEAQFASEFGEPQRRRLDASLLDTVATIDGVAVAEGMVEGFAQISGSDGDPLGGTFSPTFGGSWLESDALNPFTVVEGRAPEAPGEVAIDRGSARRGDLAVGDETTVVTEVGPVPASIVGITRFGDADSPGGASYALFTLEEAQRLIAGPGRLDGIWVVAAEGTADDEVVDRVAAVVPAGVEVVTGAAVTAQEQEMVRDGLAFFNTFVLAFAVIALFVGAFIIYNTFSIIVAQRTRGLALLRALGASRRQVIASVLVEALVVGVVASLAGIVVGIGVAAVLRALFDGAGADLPPGPTVVTSATVVIAMAIGVIVSLGAAAVPARRASRVPPLAAMQDVAIDASGRSRSRVVMGTVVTALGGTLLLAGLLTDAGDTLAAVAGGAGLVFLGVAVLGPVLATPLTRVVGAPLPRFRGTVGTLARQNAMRNPKRTSATAAALMIGVGLVGFITVFAESARTSFSRALEGAFRGDFVVDSGSTGFGGLNPELAAELAARPEIAVASPLRIAHAAIDGNGQMLLAVEPDTVDEIMDIGVVEGDLGSLGEGSIAVLSREAERRGLGLGDTVPVQFTETGVQELAVAAIYADSELTGDWLLGIPTVQANARDQFDLLVLVNGAEGVPAADTRAAIESVTADHPLAQVQDRTQYRDAQLGQFNQLLGLVYVLLALAVLIALLGIANTLALSIVERTRELGLLRAVGMTTAQLRASVRWESVIIALLGTVLGLAVGLFFGWAVVTAMHDDGITELRVPPGQLLVIAVVAAAAGVLAAIPPARRAARLDVLRAIGTD